jgi:hypothetical protein
LFQRRHATVSIETLKALSNKKRRARLDAIRAACRAALVLGSTMLQ